MARLGMPAYSVSLRMHRTLTAAAVFIAEIAAGVAYFCARPTHPEGYCSERCPMWHGWEKRLGCGPFLCASSLKRGVQRVCVNEMLTYLWCKKIASEFS